MERIRSTYGIRIDAVPGKGYRLAKPVEFLDPEAILGMLSGDTRSGLSCLIVHDQVASTNTWLMQRIPEGMASGTACLAEQQKSGKGRHGRTWVSPFGSNIYLSLLWRFSFPPAGLAGLSLAAGVGVALALSEVGVKGLGLKWPNDVLWDRRKLAGLLIEVSGEAQGPTAVVCGIGVNTLLSEGDAQAIDQPWTDLSQILGSGAFSRNTVAARVLDRLVWVMREYERGRLETFLPMWRRFDAYQGQRIALRLGDETIRGTHAGIDDTGALRLVHERGISHFMAGEVTLRILD